MKPILPTSIRKAALIIIALFGLNAGLLSLAERPASLHLAEWRKGPVIHKNSFYGPTRAPGYFWLFSALFIDVYALSAWGLAAALLRPNRHDPARRIIAAAGALIIAITATEIAVRWTAARAQPGHFRPHPDVFYYNRANLNNSREFPNATPESTSSRAFRGTNEFPNAKPPGEYRIFVVGDSSAFGHGVLDDQTFSVQLERILNEWVQGQVRVINAACPGHCTYEGLIIHNRMGVPLDPDLLIVAYNNDASPEYQEEKTRAPYGLLTKAMLRVLYKSDYFLLFQRSVANAVLALQHRTRTTKPQTVSRVSLEDHTQNLLAFQESAARHNSRVLYVNMPVNHSFLEQAPERRIFYNPAYPQALLKLCRQNNLSVVDVDGELTRSMQPDVFLAGHHFHPNPKGHRLIAEQIAPALMPFIAERMKLRPRIVPGATLIQTPAGPLEGTIEEPERDTPSETPITMPEWQHVVRIGYSTLTPLHALIGETLQKTPAAAEADLTFQFMQFLHGKDQDEACRKNLVDLTFSCEVPAIVHFDRCRDMAILGTLGELGHIALITTTKSPIHKTAQLKNKTIAVADGASARLLLEQWLLKANLIPGRDVNIRILKGDGREALESLAMGVTDAAVLWDPWLTELGGDYALRVIEHAPFWSLLLISQTYAQARPENIPNILKAVRLALDWAKANPAPASLFVTRASGLTLSTVNHVLAKNRFLQPQAPPEFAFEPDVIQRLRACHVFAIKNHLAAPDTPLVFFGTTPATAQP